MASNLREIVSLWEKETSGNSWFWNITKLPWNSKHNFITFLCQGSKLSPRSIYPNHLLPGTRIKIGVRAQNSQILSHGTRAKIPVEIFNWVQTPVNGDALIRMLIKLSSCCWNHVALILSSSGGADSSFSHCTVFPLQPAGASHSHLCQGKRGGSILGLLPKALSPDGSMAFKSWSDLESCSFESF